MIEERRGEVRRGERREMEERGGEEEEGRGGGGRDGAQEGALRRPPRSDFPHGKIQQLRVCFRLSAEGVASRRPRTCQSFLKCALGSWLLCAGILLPCYQTTRARIRGRRCNGVAGFCRCGPELFSRARSTKMRRGTENT